MKVPYSDEQVNKFIGVGSIVTISHGLDCPICGTSHNDACGCGGGIHISGYISKHSIEEIKQLLELQPQWSYFIDPLTLIEKFETAKI